MKRIALAIAFATFAVPASLLTSAQQPAASQPGLLASAPAIARADWDNDKDGKHVKSHKMHRPNYLTPPGWYNGHNGYFKNGSWHRYAPRHHHRDNDKH